MLHTTVYSGDTDIARWIVYHYPQLLLAQDSSRDTPISIGLKEAAFFALESSHLNEGRLDDGTSYGDEWFNQVYPEVEDTREQVAQHGEYIKAFADTFILNARQAGDTTPPTFTTCLLHLPSPLTFTTYLHYSPSPLAFTTHLHHSPSPPTFITCLHYLPSPLTFTTHLHHSPSPLAFTTCLHHSPSPLAFTTCLHHLPSPLTFTTPSQHLTHPINPPPPFSQ